MEFLQRPHLANRAAQTKEQPFGGDQVFLQMKIRQHAISPHLQAGCYIQHVLQGSTRINAQLRYRQPLGPEAAAISLMFMGHTFYNCPGKGSYMPGKSHNPLTDNGIFLVRHGAAGYGPCRYGFH